MKIAQKYVWWKPPEDALINKNHFLAQLMTLGSLEDCFYVLRVWGKTAFIEALKKPPIGVFNGRSWHYKLDLAKKMDDIPPLPARRST